jgi:hypothetical protein
MTGDPHVLQPDHAPTPFTAAEIRAGCPQGRTIELLVDVAGQPSHRRTNRFVECDEEGAVVERTRFGLDGSPLGPPELGRSSWLEMQGHASTPATRTSIEPAVLTSPMGALECLRYTVVDAEQVETLWFARSMPGMPVRTESRRDGELVATVAMVSNYLPRSDARGMGDAGDEP